MNALKKLPPRQMTVPEFLAWAAEQRERWQLRDGLPELMAPAADRHGSIQAEIARRIGNHLAAAGSRCRVVVNPGIVPHLRADRNMLVPDVAVTCAPSSASVAVPDPVVLIEILSPSNEAQTRANVWAFATIASVSEIILVTSWEIAAEVLRRDAGGNWPKLPEKPARDDVLRIDRIDFEIPLRDLYRTTDLLD
jgi:Uma2 family endonuclease